MVIGVGRGMACWNVAMFGPIPTGLPVFCCKKSLLGGDFKYFLFSTLPGEMIQFD